MLVNIIREVTETKATPGVLDASLAGEFKVTHSSLNGYLWFRDFELKRKC